MNLNVHNMENKTLVKINNIAIALGLSVLIVCINAFILNQIVPYWHIPISAKNIPLKQVITGLTIAPLGEELVFRLIPFKLSKFLIKDETFNNSKYYIAALIACVFG